MFHKFVNRYLIEGEIEATTAMHIGAAVNEFNPGGNKNPFFRNAEGLPMIPGSSLKGVMRSFMEQFLISDAGKEKFGEDMACSEMKPCVGIKDEEFKKLLKDRTDGAEVRLSEKLFGKDGKYGKLCMACRIFGSHSSSAKLLVRDAKVREETFHNDFEIRSGNSIDRDLGKNKKNHVYEVETVPEGTRFSFQAILENADEKEWECVSMLLRAMSLGLLTVGGMKSRGLGGMVLQDIKIQKIDTSKLMDYLTGKNIVWVSLDNAAENGGGSDVQGA